MTSRTRFLIAYSTTDKNRPHHVTLRREGQNPGEVIARFKTSREASAFVDGWMYAQEDAVCQS